MTNNDLAVELLQQRKKKREDPQSATTQTSTQNMSGQAALAQELLSQRIQARKEREATQPTVSLPSQRIDPAKERQESNGKFNGWKYFGNLGKTLLTGVASLAQTGAMAEDVVTSAVDTIFKGANTKGSGLFNALYHGRPDWKFLGENGLVGIEQEKAYLDQEREAEVAKIKDDTLGGKVAKKAASYGGDIAYGVGGAIPMAATAGVAAAPIVNGVATSTEALANLGASVVERSGVLNALGKGFRDTLRSKDYWMAFTSEVGADYQEALSDGASTGEAMNYAIATSLLNSVIEVGGGIQKVPENFSVKNLLRSAAEEGMEEIWQGPVGRTMQNVVYGANNPIVSTTDDRAIFNPVTSAQEFAGGFTVGGILSGAQMAAGKAANSIYSKQVEKQSQRYKQAQARVKELSGVKGTYQTGENGKTTVGGNESAIKSVVKGGQIEMANGEVVSPDKVKFADRNTADLYEGAISRAANAGAANVFIDSYTGGDVSRYLLGMQEAYEDGRAGVVTEKRGTFADDLTDAQRTAAWNQGAADGLQTFRTDTGLGENGSAAWTQVQQNQAVRSNPRLRTGFTSMYQAGLSGKALTDVKSDAARYIPPSVQTAAYQAGLADAASSLAREKAGVKLVTKSNEAGLVDNDYSKKLANNDTGTARVLGSLASDMGVRIEIVPQVQGGAANGKYVKGTNTVLLAADAENPLSFVAAHEVTHRMQDAAPTEYRAYRDAVMEYQSSELGDDTTASMVERYREASRKAGVTLTQEEAMDEIAADFTAKMINDTDLFGRFADKNRSAAGKLLDGLKAFISRVKTLFTGKARDKAAQEAYGENFDKLQKVAELWQKAYDAATETMSETVSVVADARVDEISYDDAVYSVRVTDEELKRWLDRQDTVKTYKTMQIVGGKLYPPMAARVDGQYEDNSILGEWEAAVERPDLADKTGKFKLDKGKGNGSIKAAYNPYMHSSNLVINDQFSGAYKRNNLVTVECEVPASELTSGYHAEKAKDSVGWHDWHTGTVAGQIRNKKGIERKVFLSRWIKPVRILSDSEVAGMYKDLLSGTDIAVPDNVVTPSLLDALRVAGVKIVESGRVQQEAAAVNADESAKLQIRRKYWKPQLRSDEWALLNRKLDEEIGSSEQYLDESTKWLYADEKGVQVFALYGIGDGTEATPLYAVGGKQADACSVAVAEYIERREKYDRNGGSADSWVELLWSKKGSRSGNLPQAQGPAGDAGAVYGLHGGSQNGNVRGTSGRSTPDQREVKEKFSLRAPVERTKDLVAVHNLTEQNLRDAFYLGGLPMPSIAVVKAAQGHSMYGPISIVFGRESIDPQTDSRNKIYGGDAYTPTAPAVEYPVNYDRMRAVEKRLAGLSEKVAGGVFRNDSALQRAGVGEESGMSAPELADKLARDDSIRAAYLADQGKTLEPVMQAKEFNRYGNDSLSKLVQKIGVQKLADIEASMEAGDYQPVQEIEDTVRQIIRDSYEEQHRRFLDRKPELKEKRINYFMENNVHTYTVENFVRNAWEYYQDQGATTSEIDRWATSDKLHEAASTEDVKAWLLPQLEGVLGEPGIYNGSERFDKSGSRRSFSQLHWEYTLENIVRAMTETQAERGGQTFGASAKAMQAVSTEDFQSIDAVKAASGRLGKVDTDQYKADVDAVEKRIEQATRAVMRENKAHSDSQFDEMQIIGDVMMQAAQGKQTEAAIRRAFSKEGYSISKSTAARIREMFRAAAELPTGYFEAKPQRAVGFNEVLAAVIPDNSSAEIRQSLSDAGVRVIEYPAGDETGRLNAVNSVDNARFQLKSQTQIETEMRDMKKERDRLKTRVKSLERQVARWKAETKPSMPSFREGDLKKLGNRLINDFDSSTKYSEIKTDMENLGKALLSQDVPDTDLHAYAEYVAEKIIQNSRVLEEGGEDLLEIQKHLKSVKLAYTDDGSIADFSAWKKAHRDIKFAKDGGLPVDVAYHELTDVFGGGYFPESITNPADQLTRMGEILEDIDNIWSNPYDEYHDIAVTALGNSLIEIMISDDVRQTRPTYADRKEKEIAHLKDLLSKTRAGRDEKIKQMRTAYAERTKSGAEKRKAREMRARIARHTDALSQKLLHPTDKQHIPEQLRTPVAALLRVINTESSMSYDESGKLRKGTTGSPTKRTQEAIRLREAYDEILSSDPNFVVDPALFGEGGQSGFIDQLVELGSQRIGDMNSEQLNVVWKAIKGIETTITSYDKALASGKYMFISQWANDLRSGVSSRKRANKKAVLSLYDPRTFFNAYGDAGLDVFRALRNAEDTQNRRVAEVAKLTEKFMSREVYKQRNERHTFTTEAGQTITLTNDQIMNLYNLANRGKHSMQHLSIGGVIQPYIKRDGKLPAIERGTKSIPLTANDVAQITDVLTDEQIKVAKGLQKIASTMLAKWGNEASMAVYGYNKFTEEHYWPIKSAREAIVQNAERGENMPREIRNMGSAKALNENASNTLDLGGVFDVFTKNASDMITYSTMLEPMEDINRLFNYRYRDSAGNLTGKNVKNVLTDVYGEQALKYWRNLMSDVQNGIAHDDEPITRMIEKFVGRTKAASVGMNARVVLQQPTAFFRAAAILDPSDMAKGLVKAPTKGNGWKKAKQYAGIAAIKDSSGFDQAGQYTIMKGILNGADQTFMDKLSDASGAAAAKADAVTWGKIWNACEYTVQKEGRYEVGSEDFYTRTAEVFSDVIDQSQVVDGILQRTQIMRSGNGLTKQATAFMGEPMKSLNMLLRSYDAWRYETNPSKKSAALKQFARTSIALLVTDGVNALVQSLVDAARKDDKDKDYWGRYFEVLTGVTGEDDTVVSVLLGSNLWDNIDPVGRIPFAKDIKSMLQGYTVSRMDADAVSDFIAAAQLFTKATQGDGQKTTLYAFKQLLVTGSKIFGISVGNIGRDTWAVARSIAQETGSYWAMYQMEQMIYRVAPDAKNSSRYYSILYHALQDDKAAYDRIYADLISKGYTDKQIKTGMKNAIKNAGGSDMLSQLEDVGFSREDAETVIKQQEFKQSYGFSYDDLADEYADGNISRREVIRALQNVGGLSAEDAELKATAYDWKNAGVSDATNAIVKAYQSYGSDAGFDKKSFSEAYKDLNAVKGEDTDGDGKIEKKQFVLEAINKMNISTAQKDALYRMKGYGEKQLADAPWH